MKNKLLIALSLILLSTLIFSFNNKPSASVAYEYVQIIVSDKNLRISTSTTYTSTDISNTVQGQFDCSVALKAVEEYQGMGFELVSNSIDVYLYGMKGPITTHNYILRKVK